MQKRKQQSTREADLRFKKFWGNNERFADLFNTVVFRGKQVVKPEELWEQDTVVSEIVAFKDLATTIERTRDILKISKNGTRLLLLGIENQKQIHYGMPLKSLTYDVLGYIKEAKELAKKHKSEKGLTSAEFLSGMKKGDKLTPIITLVIYYGEDPWDGPLTLRDMLKSTDHEQEFYQTEHQITLLQVTDSDHYYFHNEETETVFHISRELFRGNAPAIKEEYKDKDLSQELLEVIGCITGVKNLVEQSEKGSINMCRAIDEMIRKERQDAAQRAKKDMKKKLSREMEDLGIDKKLIAKLKRRVG